MKYIRLILIVAAAVCSSFNVMAQYRTSPECLNEQLTKDALLAALSNPDVAAGTAPPPGALNMTGPFGDPLYSDSGWEKREWTQYFKNTKLAGGSIVTETKFTVQLHFMWNSKTRQVDQIKFKTTTDQGCVGAKVTTTTSGGVEVTPVALIKNGYSIRHLGSTSFTKLHSGTVEVGPIVEKSLSSFGVWAGGGMFGNGSYGGFAPGGGAGGGCANCYDYPVLAF